MRSHHDRFEEAFKKLQQEVAHKTSKGLINKDRNLRLPPPEIEEKTPKPPKKSLKKRSRKFKPISSAKTTEIKVAKPEIIRFEPVNPRLFRQMLRAAESDTIKCKIIDVKPTVHWDERPIGEDMSFYERNLATETVALHKLVEPIDKKFEGGIGDKLPLDFFDCFNDVPEDELRSMNGVRNIKGYTKLSIKGKDKWHPCIIVKYKEESHTYIVRVDDIPSIYDSSQPLIKEVSRFNIKFNKEDSTKFDNRLKLAEGLRNQFELETRTNEFLDSLPNDDDYTSFIRPEFKEKLTDDALNVIIRVQKMFDVRGDIQINDETVMPNIIKTIGIDMDKYTPKNFKYPFTLDTQRNANLEKIESNPFIISIESYINATIAVQSLIYFEKEAIIKGLNDLFTDKSYTVSKWGTLLYSYENWFINRLFDFTDNVSNTILKNLSGEIDKDDKLSLIKLGDVRPYYQFLTPNKSIFQRFKKCIGFMLKEFALSIIDYNVQFFTKMLTFDWKELKFEHVNDEDFTTISQSMTDELMRTNRPHFIIDMESNKQEVTKLLTDFFNVIPSNIIDTINPFSTLFEQANSRLVANLTETGFSTFIKANNKDDKIPPKFIFNINSIKNYIADTEKSVLSLINEHSTHAFDVIPILAKETNSISQFFLSQKIPEVFDSFNYITKLIRQKDFFFINFPYFIYLGEFELDLSEFRESIFNCVEKHRISVLEIVADDLNNSVAELRIDFEKLFKQLKKPILNPEQWAIKDAIIHEIPETLRIFQERSDYIDKLYELLMDSSYGLYSDDIKNMLNIKWWPILIDMELGKTIDAITDAGESFREQMPIIISQSKEELNKTREKKMIELKYTEREQMNNYIVHLEQKIEKLNEIEVKLKNFNYSEVMTPRVNLWYIVTVSQKNFDKWSKMPINELDLHLIKVSIDTWNKELRMLTKDFYEDKYCLKELISTKNDIQLIMPLFRAVSQILSDKIKPHNRGNLENIIGRKNFEYMTINEMREINILEKIPAITKLYNISKSEDKTDIELINTKSAITEMRIIVENNKVSNLAEIFKELVENKSVLKNILSDDTLAKSKQNVAAKLQGNIRDMYFVADSIDSIQENINLLSPLQKTVIEKDIKEKMNSSMKIFKNLAKSYSELLSSIGNKNLLLEFATNDNQVNRMRNLMDDMQQIKMQLVEIIISFRSASPRLIFVPDTKIIDTFSDDIEIKISVLSLVFPGVDEWIFSKNKISGVMLNSGDTIEFEKHILLRDTVFTQIPLISSTIHDTLRNMFFKAINNEIDISYIPFQLQILMILYNNETPIPEIVSKQQKKVLLLLKETLKSIKNPISVTIEDDSVFIHSGEYSLEYAFQVSLCDDVFFSPYIFEKIMEIIEAYSQNKPVLIHSQFYSLSFYAVKLFSFICGRTCFLIHSTQSVNISRIKEILEALDNSKIIVCLDETHLLKLNQMYDIATSIKTNLICTATANSIPLLLQTGKINIKIDHNKFIEHINYIGKILFESQKGDVDFITTTITKYVHPYILQKYFSDFTGSYSGKLNFNFLESFRMVIPEDVLAMKNIGLTNDSIKTPDRKLNVGITILNTKEFKGAFSKITFLLKSKTHIFLIAGPEYSGKSTVVMASAMSVGLQYYKIAFTNENWIKTVSETMIRLNEKPCVYHLLVPFAGAFLSHATSIFEKSFACEGDKSLMSIGNRSYIVFELMNPMIMSHQISIPIVSYTKPLISLHDLLNFWIVNSKIVISEEDLEMLKNKITLLIFSCSQLYQFFQIFVPLYFYFNDIDEYSIRSLIMYSIFWSNSSEMKNSKDFKLYSDKVKSCFKGSFIQKGIHEYSFNPNIRRFELNIIQASDNFGINNDVLINSYVESQCGPIIFTNIPVLQFVNPVQQIPLVFFHNNQSCLVVGGKGTGKTTIIQYIADACCTNKDCSTIRFNGNDATVDDFIKSIKDSASISSDGTLYPRFKKFCVIIFDPLPSVESSLYGTILTAIKSNLIIIGNRIHKISNFMFLMTSERIEHQIASSSYIFNIPPYTKDDLIVMGQELITRTLLYRGLNQIKTAKVVKNTQKILSDLSDVVLDEKVTKTGFLHLFFNVLRNIWNFNYENPDDAELFLQLCFKELYPDYTFSLPDSKELTLYEKADPKSMMKEFIYTFGSPSTIINAMKTKAKYFQSRIDFGKESTDFIFYITNLLSMKNSHSLIIDDASIDYESLVRFSCFFTDTKFVSYQKEEQISQLITNSICSNENVVLFFREPEAKILKLVYEKLKYPMVEMLSKTFTDTYFKERVNQSDHALCEFPYANINTKEIKETEKERHKLKATLTLSSISGTFSSFDDSANNFINDSYFRYMSFHMFRNIHFVSCIPYKREINERVKQSFSIWNRKKSVIEYDYTPLKGMFAIMHAMNDRFFVDTNSQVQRVINMFGFIKKSVESYVQSRRQFMTQVLSVMKSIELAVEDNQNMVDSIKEQIKLDNIFLLSNEETINFREDYLKGLQKESEKLDLVLEEIYAKDNQYNKYRENDASNTLEEYKIATKNVCKAFTQDEQYNLYIQQKTDDKTRALFDAFCILYELTPRNGEDYWSEARGYLRVGRFAKMLRVFDPNTIRKDTVLKLDICMRNPIISESNFPKESALMHLVTWLKAVHRHTKSTNFEKTVQIQMVEHSKLMKRKEIEKEKLIDRIKAAKEDLEKYKENKVVLVAKIDSEKELLNKYQDFIEKANNVCRAFPTLREDLEKFINGEKIYGKNEMGFILQTTVDASVIPMLPFQQRIIFKKKLTDLFNDSCINSEYFVTMKGIVNTDDPLALSLLSGTRLIACYDPQETEYDIIGGNGKKPIPVLSSKFSFIYTSPEESDFNDKIIKAATKGMVLIITHGDSVINHPFLSTPSSESTTVASLNDTEYSIDKRFRIIFFLDAPPTNLSSHFTFIHTPEIPIEKIESVLLGDDSPILAYEKVHNFEQIAHSQKESVYRSIQKILTELERVHSSDPTVLEDVQLQSILMVNSLKKLKDSTNAYQRMQDSNQGIVETATNVRNIIMQIQNMTSLSPLYLFPFSKVKKILKSTPSEMNAYDYLLAVLASSLCPHHKWMIHELKNVQSMNIANEKINILHFNDVSLAAKFIMKEEGNNISYYSIEESSKFTSYEKDLLRKDIENGAIPVFTFFDENVEYGKALATYLLTELDKSNWNESSHVYLMVDTLFKLPSSIINNSCLQYILQ